MPSKLFSVDDAKQTLRQRFGLNDFRPGQQQVIESLFAGRSAVAVFPTGGGKSLCYQLPALHFSGLTLVVSPLIALMKDQIEGLANRGVTAIRLDSSLTNDEFRDSIALMRQGDAKILYVSPERFFNERFRESMSGVEISLFAVDEAHCISQWGHNFRPDYLKLASIAKQYRAERILALTATATPQVLDDIRAAFDIAESDAICTPFFRSNLQLQFTSHDAKQRDQALIDRLKKRPAGASLVYVTLQNTSEQLAELLASHGLDARPYHAGLPDEQRNEVQKWFMESATPIIVATIAFGMGIDKSNIRYVYNYNPAKSLESYAQEIGRAGRDGNDAICETLLVPEDRVVLENFAFGDTPTESAIEMLVERISGQPELFHLSYYRFSNECDIRLLVVRTLMTYLELDGYLDSTSPRYDIYEFKSLVSSHEILTNFQGEPREFLKKVFACAEKRRVWFHLDITRTAQRLHCDRSRIVKAIDHLAEKGWMEVRVSELVHGYRRLKPIANPTELAKRLFERVVAREKSEIARIDQVYDLAVSSECQSGLLSAHFGQTIDRPCGRCSACLSDLPLKLPPTRKIKIGSSAITGWLGLAEKYPDVLAEPRQGARFLCGFGSPALTRARLTRDGLFGCCAHLPFAQVLAACDQAVG